MKKLVLLCLLAYATVAVAQKKSLNIDSLIKSKSFIFVVNEVKPKLGAAPYSSSNGNNMDSYNVNLALVSPKQREQLGSMQVAGTGDYVQQYYRRLAQLDASYTTAFQTNSQYTNSSIKNESNAIYYIQENDHILLNDNRFPTTIMSIKNSDFKTTLDANYKLESTKKKNGKWTLTYKVKTDNSMRSFYLKIDPEGNALLNQSSGNLIGFIAPSK